MTDDIPSTRLFDDPAARRLWLLREALRVAPLDRALELARSAEAFVTDCTSENMIHSGAPATVSAQVEQQQSAALPPTARTKDRGIALTDEQRGRLLDRLAEGARNAELVAEFGISAKQIQGVRMGSKREIAKRRADGADAGSQLAERHHDASAITSIEEIVRYLRQQDDVVVLQQDGVYLVNGRFHLSAAELVIRANRMRSRQRKPPFQSHGAPHRLATASESKGHPLFWEKTVPAEPDRSGLQPAIDVEGA
jgi:hypothetical protein